MGIKIFLDDVREVPGGWELARTSFEFTKLVSQNPENIDQISFDNDLGPGQIEGWELVNWLRDEIKAGKVKKPHTMDAHSMSPVARRRINATIKEIYGLNNG